MVTCCVGVFAGEKGVTVLSTPSTVLFCNLTLQSGDTHSGMTSSYCLATCLQSCTGSDYLEGDPLHLMVV